MDWRMAWQLLLYHLRQLFPGIVRKVAIPFFVLATVGWLLVVIGFGIGVNNPGVNINRDEPTSYPFWFVSIGGPVVIAVGVIHAAVSHRYTRFIGSIITLFSVFFITAHGMILYYTGLYIQLDDPNHVWVNVEFAGALISTFSWTAVMILWPFYDNSFSFYDNSFSYSEYSSLGN